MNLIELYNRINPYVVRLEAQQIQFDESLRTMGTGSGFLSGDGYLITNFHVMKKTLSDIELLNNYKLVIKRYIQSAENPAELNVQTIECSAQQIKQMITGYNSEEHVNDYIILNLNKVIPSNIGEIDDLKFYDRSVFVGQRCCLFGCPFGKDRLSMHECIISSIYECSGVVVYQLDGSVNNGNSGGPLIDLETGKLIGIVSRKEDGLSAMFKKLKSVIQENHSFLDEAVKNGVVISVGNIDAVRALAASFGNLRGLIDHIERSANVGIGYALSASAIEQDLNMLRVE